MTSDLSSSDVTWHVPAAVSVDNQFENIDIPQNPHMGKNDFASAHGDSYCSESVSISGPNATSIRVICEPNRFGFMPVMTCNDNNQMVGITLLTDENSDMSFSLQVFDTECKPLSTTYLGPMPGYNSFGGGYFYMDDQNRSIVASQNTMICYDTSNVTSTSGTGDDNSLSPVWTTPNIVQMITGSPDINSVYSTLPVWGNDPTLYWVLLAGKFDLETGKYDAPAGIAVIQVTDDKSPNGCTTSVISNVWFQNEWNNNTFAADEYGAMFVTNVLDENGKTSKGYLRYARLDNGKIIFPWTSETNPNGVGEYKNSGELKPGMGNIGSGTTPTVMTTKEGKMVVAIGDNDSPQMNVVVFDRWTGEKLSETPVFKSGQSADEASFIGVQNSIIAENNYNHYVTYPNSQLTPPITPGMARVDISGDAYAKEMWNDSTTSFLGMSMLARGNGVVYAHTAEWDAQASTEGAVYYVSAIDSANGKLIWRVPLGRGVSYCHDFGGVYFDHNGNLFVGTQNYICSVQNAT